MAHPLGAARAAPEIDATDSVGGISLTAGDAPLVAVKREITATVSLTLMEKGPPVEDPLTLSYKSANWEELILKLLSRCSYALIWGEESDRPRSMVVFGMPCAWPAAAPQRHRTTQRASKTASAMWPTATKRARTRRAP